MEKLVNIYGKRFFARRYKLSWRAPFVCEAIKKVFNPMSVVDVGAAIGDLVKGFQNLGIHSVGIEGSNEALKFLECPATDMYFLDLRVQLPDLQRMELVTCFEVLEHIEEEYCKVLVGNLCRLSDNLLLSAAPPGQGGHHHVNCQEPEYWETEFMAQGYGRDKDAEEEFKKEIHPWRHKPGIKAFHMNALCFRKYKLGGGTNGI